MWSLTSMIYSFPPEFGTQSLCLFDFCFCLEILILESHQFSPFFCACAGGVRNIYTDIFLLIVYSSLFSNIVVLFQSFFFKKNWDTFISSDFCIRDILFFFVIVIIAGCLTGSKANLFEEVFFGTNLSIEKDLSLYKEFFVTATRCDREKHFDC